MEQRFYKCSHCGKIIAIVKESGVPIICCGQKMNEIIAGSTDAAQEKHIPVYRIENNKVIVSVGDVEHPMTAEHLIEWVSIKTKQGNQRKALTAGQKPQVTFAICEDDELEAVYAYCNLHGLWQAEISAKSVCNVPKTKLANGDYIVCNCNQVSYMDIVNELQKHNDINNLLKAFENVKETTRCSTGCGGCYDKVMEILSDIMNN